MTEHPTENWFATIKLYFESRAQVPMTCSTQAYTDGLDAQISFLSFRPAETDAVSIDFLGSKDALNVSVEGMSFENPRYDSEEQLAIALAVADLAISFGAVEMSRPGPPRVYLFRDEIDRAKALNQKSVLRFWDGWAGSQESRDSANLAFAVDTETLKLPRFQSLFS